MKIDVCIPTCCPNALDLIMTLQSCERALQYSGFDYLYYIASNGTPVDGPARKSLNCGVHYAKQTGRLGHVFDVPLPLNPAGGRNLAASAGSGEVIFFLDDHCLIHENFFINALLTHQATGAASIRGLTWLNGWNVYRDSTGKLCVESTNKLEEQLHRTLDFDAPFWGDKSLMDRLPGNGNAPYRAGGSGHGAFSILRSVWNDVGGYWSGLTSFQLEEILFDLTLALLDYEIWISPAVQHWHKLCTDKPYSHCYDSRTVETMLSIAYVIGDERWADKAANTIKVFIENQDEEDKFFGRWIYDVAPGDVKSVLLPQAIERSKDYKKWLSGKRSRTLEQQIRVFELLGVPMVKARKLAA